MNLERFKRWLQYRRIISRVKLAAKRIDSPGKLSVHLEYPDGTVKHWEKEVKGHES